MASTPNRSQPQQSLGSTGLHCICSVDKLLNYSQILFVLWSFATGVQSAAYVVRMQYTPHFSQRSLETELDILTDTVQSCKQRRLG